jgi:phytoene dehydrogenase-like protein
MRPADTMEPRVTADLVVVGGGLAGLAAAAFLVRAGRSVVVLERAGEFGGRARTQSQQGFHFNMGPHALYRAGVGIGVLRELGIEPHGGLARLERAFALRDGALLALPTTPLSLVTSRLFSAAGKLEAARVFLAIERLDPRTVDHISTQAWLAQQVRRADVRQFFEMVIRVGSFTQDLARQSAGAGLEQLRIGRRGGALYLDGGWQSLVDRLRQTAEAAGASIRSGARVAAVEYGRAVHGVRLADGTRLATAGVLLAVNPNEAATLLQAGPAASLARGWAEAAIPARLATLEVGLARLPRPETRFVFGLDRSVYLVVHSAYAKLAPEGGAMIHVAKYLDTANPNDPRATERELESLLDLAQPGWRAALVARRFLPSMVVDNALPTAVNGGASGRPGPAVPGVAGLYLAGDWVGPTGLLSDAALSSARAAAQALAQTETRHVSSAA